MNYAKEIKNIREAIAELDEQKKVKADEMREMHEAANAETRSMNDEENEKWNTLEKEADAIEDQIRSKQEEIRKIEKLNNMTKEQATTVATPAEKEGRNFFNELQNLREGKIQTLELRDMAISVDGKGKELGQTEYEDIVSPLFAKTILDKIGIKRTHSNNASVTIPRVLNIGEAEQVAEGASLTKKDMDTDSVLIVPKRYGIQVAVSNQFLDGTPVNNAYIMGLMQKAVAEKVNKDWIALADTVANVSTFAESTAAAPTKKATRNLKTMIGKLNISTEGAQYITNCEGVALLEDVKVDAGSGKFLLEGNKMNGYSVLESNLIESTATDTPLYFIQPENAHFIDFGTPRISVDSTSAAVAGKDQVVFTINLDLGMGFSRNNIITKINKMKL